MSQKEYYIFIWIITVFCICNSCAQNTDSKNITKEAVCKNYSYPLNQDSTVSFGFKYYSDFDIVAPNSICLDDQFIFITDTFHNRIKRININNGELYTSPSLPEEIGKVNDCLVFRDKVFVVSTNGYVIIMSNDLNDYHLKKVSRGIGKIISKRDNQIKIYFPSDELKSFSLDADGNVQDTMIGRVDFKDLIHGKKFVANDELITKYYQLSKEIVKYKPLNYGGINIDYTTDHLVYFTLNKNQLILSICEIK